MSTTWVAFWNILLKDMRSYYIKPPNISWGIIFPLAWTLMVFIRSGGPLDAREMLPGVMCLSVLFGTTSMLAVTITFERMGRSFDRLLLAPISLNLLLLAKTGGAILFGIINGFAPVALAAFLGDLSAIDWPCVLLVVVLVAATSAFLGLFIAVSVHQVFEAQTFSNFFRFPMIFLCGLFIPLEAIPAFLRAVSYALPLTYGADSLKILINGKGHLALGLDLLLLALFGVILFCWSARAVKTRWIL